MFYLNLNSKIILCAYSVPGNNGKSPVHIISFRPYYNPMRQIVFLSQFLIMEIETHKDKELPQGQDQYQDPDSLNLELLDFSADKC